MNRKIVIAVNTSWNIVNFRSGLIKSLVSEGNQIIIIAPQDGYTKYLPMLGCRHINLQMDNKGKSPWRDFRLLLSFLKILLSERPCVYMSYTPKPNIYGSIAAHLLGIPVINNVAGLGAAFEKQGVLNILVSILYKFALSKSVCVFFQNHEDCNLFIKKRLVNEHVANYIPGSGVDLNKFIPLPLPNRKLTRFLLVGRLLWSKGIAEYTEAARMLKNQGVNAEFYLLGFLEQNSHSGVTRQKVSEWTRDGIIYYLGSSSDVRKEISDADCIVLPSFYREGTPRVLLEAAAMARPIIATDWVGCRDVVCDGVNGYLCNPRDARDLANKMLKFLELSNSARINMGIEGRKKVENKFSENIVIKKYIDILNRIPFK